MLKTILPLLQQPVKITKRAKVITYNYMLAYNAKIFLP